MSEIKKELKGLISTLEIQKEDHKSKLKEFVRSDKLTQDEICKREFMRGEILTITRIIPSLKIMLMGVNE